MIVATSKTFGQIDSVPRTEEYFEFKATPKTLSPNFRVEISFGLQHFGNDPAHREKVINTFLSFKSPSEALDLMNKYGWTLVTAYATSHDHFYTYYYIMKRNIKNQ